MVPQASSPLSPSRSVQADGPVPIRQQLTVQLALQIASGQRLAGQKLPSVRGLAQRLGIHYNTVSSAYKALEAMGLVDSQRGSGVVVRALDTAQAQTLVNSHELAQMAATMVKLAQGSGIGRNQIDLLLDHYWGNPGNPDGSAPNGAPAQVHINPADVVFFDAHADILPVYQTELSALLGPHAHLTCLSLDTLSQGRFSDTTTVLVNRYHLNTLTQWLAETGQRPTVITLDVQTGQAAMDRVTQLKAGASVAVVSCSQTLLDIVESVISGLRGLEILVAYCNTTDQTADDIACITERAQLVLHDATVTAQSTKWLGLPMIDPNSMAALTPLACQT
ncbi:MAG: GntR family transcriptional regulator [Vampirovibrionales bacterium]